MSLRGFILNQVEQIKELQKKLIISWDTSYDQRERLKVTEKLLNEVHQKHKLYVSSAKHLRSTCQFSNQCPVKELER